MFREEVKMINHLLKNSFFTASSNKAFQVVFILKKNV